MEKALSGDLLKVLLPGLAGAMAAYLFLINLTKRLFGNSKSFFRKQNFYILASVLFFALVALTASHAIFTEPGIFIIIYQVFFATLGVIHAYLLIKWFDSADSNELWHKVILTLTISIFGFLVFVFLFHLFNRDGYHFFMGSAILWFIVPFLFYRLFLISLTFPLPVLKEWVYPKKMDMERPPMNNIFLVSFQVHHKVDDANSKPHPVKASSEWQFGILFYYFLNHWNTKHPEDKIDFLNEEGASYRWTFYKVNRRWWSLINSLQYLDPEKSILLNGLREADVIICRRLKT